jgi:hypothetical protein
LFYLFVLSSDLIVIADACARHFFPEERLAYPSHSAIEATAQAALRSSLAEAPPPISADWEFEAGIALLVAFF